MEDTRFTTVVDDPAALLDVADLDEIGDIETLLMVLLDRPVGVDETCNAEGTGAALEVTLQSREESLGATFDFPFNLLELCRSCLHAAAALGPYTLDDVDPSSNHELVSLDDARLIAELQGALGNVRLFNLLEGGA